MPKQITITNIRIEEVAISKANNDYVLSVSYFLLTSEGKEWDKKRTTFKNLTPAQQTKLGTVWSFLEEKIKQIEEI